MKKARDQRTDLVLAGSCRLNPARARFRIWSKRGRRFIFAPRFLFQKRAGVGASKERGKNTYVSTGLTRFTRFRPHSSCSRSASSPGRIDENRGLSKTM